MAAIPPGEARQPGRPHQGWDYPVHRKFSSIWGAVIGTQIGADLDEFIAAARTAEYRRR